MYLIFFNQCEMLLNLCNQTLSASVEFDRCCQQYKECEEESSFPQVSNKNNYLFV